MLVVNDETISCEENCTDDDVLSRQQIMNSGGLYTYAAPRRLCVGERCNYAPQYLAVWGLVYGGMNSRKLQNVLCVCCLNICTARSRSSCSSWSPFVPLDHWDQVDVPQDLRPWRRPFWSLGILKASPWPPKWKTFLGGSNGKVVVVV